MTVEPDIKDWTWVIEKRCPECGFEAAAMPLADLPDLVRANAAAWTAVLARPDVRDRPEPDIWSPLEYGCHVRDACRVFAERLALMLTADDPLFANWDQDATAVEQDYAGQDPQQVAADLVGSAGAIADGFAGVGAEQWTRTGRRSNGSTFTVETLARYFAHDPVHHLHDVGG